MNENRSKQNAIAEKQIDHASIEIGFFYLIISYYHLSKNYNELLRTAFLQYLRWKKQIHWTKLKFAECSQGLRVDLKSDLRSD